MFKKFSSLLMISLLALTLAACAETVRSEAAPVNLPAPATENQVTEVPAMVEALTAAEVLTASSTTAPATTTTRGPTPPPVRTRRALTPT